jgi:hypothetical protein
MMYCDVYGKNLWGHPTCLYYTSRTTALFRAPTPTCSDVSVYGALVHHRATRSL